MPVFLVVPLTSGAVAPLNEAVQKAFESEADRKPLPDNRGWLVRFSGTSQEVSNKIGITGQKDGEKAVIPSAIVTAIGGYFGRAPTDVWEWIKSRMEQP